MNRTTFVLGIVGVTSVLAIGREGDARACGGCFHPPTQTQTDITDERMLLSVSPTQSTLYDQIQYTGSPTSFAWVLPIKGTVTVGLSADVLFDSIDALTATQIVAPAPNCPSPSNCNYPSATGAAGAGATLGGNGGSDVTVLKQQNVGPYATVQLHATDSSALDAWLAQNGYTIPTDVIPVINAYVTDQFDFLAMKLLPGQGVQSMRPVRVTTPGASVSLPLRMASVGTGPIVGISIWVVSDGRYEPQNYPFFHIDDSALVWDFKTNLSNYTTLRQQNETASGNKAWEIESSLELSEQLITNVILSGGQYYGGSGSSGGVGYGGGFAQAPPSDPTQDYLPVGNPDAGADAGADAGMSETAEEVRTDDVNALFAGMAGPNVRVTRMRSDIAHAAMTADFILTASADQSELSNVRNVTQSVNLTCPIYNQCSVVGTGTPAQAAASVGATSGGNGGSNGSAGQGSGVDAGVEPAAGRGSLGANPSNTAGGGGCVAASRSIGTAAGGLGAFAGMLGLSVLRIVRSRRRRAS
jgi:hypothetical protein